MLIFIKDGDSKWSVEVDRLRIEVEKKATGWSIDSFLEGLPGEPCADIEECDCACGSTKNCDYLAPGVIYYSSLSGKGGEPLSNVVKSMRNDLLSRKCDLPEHIKCKVADGWQIK